jgi:hypothetical protein
MSVQTRSFSTSDVYVFKPRAEFVELARQEEKGRERESRLCKDSEAGKSFFCLGN